MRLEVIALSLVLLCSSAVAHAQPLGPTPLAYFGLHIHRADDGTPWPPFPFGSWRLWDANVGWSSLEPEPGKWYFRRLDRYVDLAARMGVEIVLPLALTPTWASARPNERSAYRPGNAAEPRDIEDWRNYVRTVGERYRGRIRYFEIWNEPSDKTFFSGSVESLVRLASEAHHVLKAIDPAVRIISPAPAGGGHHVKYLDDYLGRGGLSVTDIVGYHFYVWKSSPEAIIPLIREVKRIMARHGLAEVPLWNTESGYWIENEDGTEPASALVKGWRMLAAREEAGAYLARSFLIARSEGIERFFWYSWDHPTSFGMREPKAGKPKPIAAAYRRIVEWLKGRQIEKCSTSAGVWTCRLIEARSHSRWIAWRESGEGVWTVPAEFKARSVWYLLAESAIPLEDSRFSLGEVPVLLSP